MAADETAEDIIDALKDARTPTGDKIGLGNIHKYIIGGIMFFGSLGIAGWGYSQAKQKSGVDEASGPTLRIGA